MTLALKGEIDYGGGLRQQPTRCSRTSTAAASVRCAATRAPRWALVDPYTYGDALGGASRVIGNAELQFPFPGSGTDRSLRWFGFVDRPGLPGRPEDARLNELRYSAGLACRWISPVGPLKLSYAKPLNAKPGDRLERFQFQMGTGF
jgi:outer membrane protein insertion porin family